MPPVKKTKKWSKPECVKVQLVPDEAVLKGCKMAGAFGKRGYCDTPVPGGTCHNLVS